MLHNEHFFPHNSQQIKNFNKNYQKIDNSTEILQGYDDKPSNNYDVDKMIQKRNDSFNQLNLDEDLPTRNMMSTLGPKQNDIKICDVMNESVGNSSNRTKGNATDDILCTVNNNLVNTGNNEFFNAVNEEFLVEIKSPSQLNEHEVSTNVTDVDFTINCNTKNTDRVILNTDNTSDEEILSESYLENIIQEFKTLIINVEDFQNKNRENFDAINVCVPEHPLENKIPNWFTSISDSEVWKKGTVLIVGDSIVSSSRESKMSLRRNIKSAFFLEQEYKICITWYRCYVNDQIR